MNVVANKEESVTDALDVRVPSAGGDQFATKLDRKNQ